MRENGTGEIRVRENGTREIQMRAPFQAGDWRRGGWLTRWLVAWLVELPSCGSMCRAGRPCSHVVAFINLRVLLARLLLAFLGEGLRWPGPGRRGR